MDMLEFVINVMNDFAIAMIVNIRKNMDRFKSQNKTKQTKAERSAAKTHAAGRWDAYGTHNPPGKKFRKIW